jgi:hypothetical protein
LKEGLGVVVPGMGKEVPKLKRKGFAELGERLAAMPERKRVTAVAPRCGHEFGTVWMSRESDQLRESGLLD